MIWRNTPEIHLNNVLGEQVSYLYEVLTIKLKVLLSTNFCYSLANIHVSTTLQSYQYIESNTVVSVTSITL